MKQTLTFVLTFLMLCGLLAPSVLATEDVSSAAETSDAVIASDSSTDTDISFDTATPSDAETTADGDGTGNCDVAPDGTQVSDIPDDFTYIGSVISFTTPHALSGTFDMACGDTGFAQLHNVLDSIRISATAEQNGSSYPLALSVTWDFSTVDAETPGIYTAMGIISTKEGAVLAEGLESTVSITVQVTAPLLTVLPSAITLTSFDEPDRTDAVAFATNTTQEELSNWFADSVAGFIGYDADGNPYDLVSGTWSLDAVNTGSAGVYYASAAPDLGTEYTLVDGVSLPRQLCAVSIQTPGEPDINCCVSGRGFLHFPWVLSAAQEEQLEEFAVWLRQDGGEWTSLSDGFLLVSDGLQLSQRIFEDGGKYDLKVAYPGGQTGVLTFQYDGELSILDYSGGDRDGGDAGGSGSGTGTQPAPAIPQTPDNSNGNDSQNGGNDTPAPDDSSSASNGKSQDSGSSPQEPQKSQGGQGASSGETQPTPPVPQTTDGSQNCENQRANKDSSVHAPVPEKPATGASPAPTLSAVPAYSSASHAQKAEGDLPEPEKNAEAQESAPLLEAYSPNKTVISSLRLRDLCKEEESVVFGSGNLMVSLPCSLLLALNLSKTDSLTVTLTQPENNHILLAVEASGKAVTELTGAVLRLRYIPQSENTDITIQNDAGEQITDVSYDGELLRFAADSAGTYTILQRSNTPEAQKDSLPLLPVSGGLLLAAGGIAFFRRRYHG